MKKITLVFFAGIIGLLLAVFLYCFFIYKPVQQKNIIWGVNFSQMQTEALKLDWRKTYLAMLEDLGVKNIKLLTQWDWVEGKKDDFYFNDIDWQITQAENNDAKLIYVVGMKTGRWPECHVPGWANDISKQEQQDALITYITQIITRYKGSSTIVAWQAENEPLFHFGQCPWYDEDFLKKEVALIHSLDPSRPVIISDSGESSMWFEAAKIGDIVSPTMYRTVWMNIANITGFYFTWPLPPSIYGLKAEIIKTLFGKNVIGGELQGEPWVYKVFYDVPLYEQEKSMNLEKFKENIEYAKQTGIGEFYLWGSEWWYWLKTTQNQPEIWNEAKKLFIH